MQVTHLAAGKVVGGDSACRFCREGELETEEHVVLDCGRFKNERERNITEGGESRSKAWAILTSGDDRSINFLQSIARAYHEKCGKSIAGSYGNCPRKEGEIDDLEASLLETARWINRKT